MTDIEQKALELVNAVAEERGWGAWSLSNAQTKSFRCFTALIRALEAHEAENARLMGLVKEAGEGLAFVADRAAKLRAGTDDWFELVEFEMICRPTLAKIKEATDA